MGWSGGMGGEEQNEVVNAEGRSFPQRGQVQCQTTTF